MRIITGAFKGRKLAVPKGGEVRPSTGKVRAALFNILGPWIENKRVLDLYAGSGAIGLEALSRGAATVRFCEQNWQVVKNLKAMLSTLKVEDRALVLCGDVHQLLGHMGGSFDLIFADPPYNQEAEELQQLVAGIEAGGLLAPGGKLFLEVFYPPPQFAMGSFTLHQSRRYGRTCLLELSN
jgi:16S rRNA (guanine966-N2)-methyltransferase